MDKIWIIIIFLLIAINIVVCIYGKVKMNSIKKSDGKINDDMQMKYVMISAISSFITVIAISIIGIIRLLR